jgi:hypothetical protein
MLAPWFLSPEFTPASKLQHLLFLLPRCQPSQDLSKELPPVSLVQAVQSFLGHSTYRGSTLTPLCVPVLTVFPKPLSAISGTWKSDHTYGHDCLGSFAFWLPAHFCQQIKGCSTLPRALASQLHLSNVGFQPHCCNRASRASRE